MEFVTTIYFFSFQVLEGEVFLKLNFSQKYPIIPAKRDEMRMANLESLIRVLSVKARMVTKIDIVNPIPPKIPTPNSLLQLVPGGLSANFSLMESQVKMKIPTGFPATSPNIIPKLALSKSALSQPGPISMEVFTSANKGRMKKGTG